MAHGVEPVFPFDITLATFLVPNLDCTLSTVDLLATRAHQLQMHDDDLASIHDNVLATHLHSVCHFCKLHQNTISSHSFNPGNLVLVRNSTMDSELSKTKFRYFGPMVVVSCTQHGAYQLTELDGAVSKLHYAAFHLIPYHSHGSLHSSLQSSSGFQSTFDREVKILGPQEM